MMAIFDRIDAKLNKYNEVTRRARVSLSDHGWSGENDLRNTIWRCLLCRRGDDCRDWLAAGRTDIPDFCPNRGIFSQRSRKSVALE